MTIKQLVDMIGGKIDKPSGGAEGQHLITNGAGGRSWATGSSIVNAAKIVIDGREYAIRTGETGENGFLTIGTNTIWLDDRTVKLDLNGSEVTKMFLASTEIYSAATGFYSVYDSGDQDGISWRGNYLPRPIETRYGDYSLAYENATPGYLLVYISNAGSTYTHNAHVMTNRAVSVPNKATKMHIRCRAENGNTIQVRFGLLPSNAANSYSTANGGVLSSALDISGTEWRDLELILPDTVKGTANLYPIINGRGQANEHRSVRIERVWFD